ncbi:MAG: 50S ribosomal protein L23 [bacterium]
MAHITDVVLRPILTEKSYRLMQDENKYTFEVDPRANKTEIKQAIQAMFNVKVESVNTINVKPKKVGRARMRPGYTKKVKKAIVTLAEDNSIDLFGEE